MVKLLAVIYVPLYKDHVVSSYNDLPHRDNREKQDVNNMPELFYENHESNFGSKIIDNKLVTHFYTF